MEIRVVVKGIKRYKSRGKWFYYHRATKTRLRAPPNSAAFIAEVKRLEAAPPATGATKPRQKASTAPYKNGTWGALVAAYRASPEFTQLAPRTSVDYDKVLDWLAAIDDMPLTQITSARCLEFRDEAFRQHKRRFANYVLHMLSVVLGWGRPRGYVAENAAAGVGKVARPRDTHDQNRAWSAEECDAVIRASAGPLRAAIALGMFAGARGGDVARMSWNAYTGQAIEWRQGKTGAVVWLPVHPMLRMILDETPRVATTIVAGAKGRPWAEGTLRKEFRALILRLLGERKVGPGLTFHGLRATAATTLADLGADVRAIQAMLGHKTAAMAFHYSRGRDTKRAATAAIEILGRRK